MSSTSYTKALGRYGSSCIEITHSINGKEITYQLARPNKKTNGFLLKFALVYGNSYTTHNNVLCTAYAQMDEMSMLSNVPNYYA